MFLKNTIVSAILLFSSYTLLTDSVERHDFHVGVQQSTFLYLILYSCPFLQIGMFMHAWSLAQTCPRLLLRVSLMVFK